MKSQGAPSLNKPDFQYTAIQTSSCLSRPNLYSTASTLQSPEPLSKVLYIECCVSKHKIREVNARSAALIWPVVSHGMMPDSNSIRMFMIISPAVIIAVMDGIV